MKSENEKKGNVARSFEDLHVYQRARELTNAIYACTRSASFSKDFGLSDQIRRAAVSIMYNVAEGFERGTATEFIQFLYIAKGSLAETLTRAIGLRATKLISTTEFEDMDALHYEVENKLLRLIESLENKRRAGDWRDTLPTANPAASQPPTQSFP